MRNTDNMVTGFLKAPLLADATKGRYNEIFKLVGKLAANHLLPPVFQHAANKVTEKTLNTRLCKIDSMRDKGRLTEEEHKQLRRRIVDESRVDEI